MLFFNQDKFIRTYITKRAESYFTQDIVNNKEELSAKIAGKSVLVIGGAGTIGSSFIKAILPFSPGKLTVVDYSENGLTELTRDLRSDYNQYMPSHYITYPFDFGGKIFAKMYKAGEWDVVACFAAHKHVRSEKDHLAIEAMVKNNVFNTKALLDLAVENPPQHFFSVSTDKAANPVNVMGASKKMMEKVLMSYTNDLKISTARFANVAFSNGSLLYGFINRIMKRQPISAPSDVKRYFVSPLESGQLCMLACLLGETKNIFFPKLDEKQMMTFSTIAEHFLAEIGMEPDYCNSDDEAREKIANWEYGMKKYPVCFFPTNTSGEKQYEEFYTTTDNVDMENFSALGVIKNDEIPDKEGVDAILNEFTEMFKTESVNKASIVSLLSKHLSDFKHIETGKSLDQRI